MNPRQLGPEANMLATVLCMEIDCKDSKEIFRYRRGTTIGVGVLSTNKVAHVKKTKYFFFVK